MIINYRRSVPMVREHDENTLLLLHGEDLTDSSMYEKSIENQGVSISSNQSKFGKKSLYFNGNSRLLIPEAVDFGSGDFTIDWWEWCVSGGSRFSSVYATGSNIYGGILLGYEGDSTYISAALSDGWKIARDIVMMSVTSSSWVHWAFVKEASFLKSYRNGSLFAMITVNAPIYYSETFPMAVGGYRVSYPDPFCGYIEEFRISNVARWTENFTPPTEPYNC